ADALPAPGAAGPAGVVPEFRTGGPGQRPGAAVALRVAVDPDHRRGQPAGGGAPVGAASLGVADDPAGPGRFLPRPAGRGALPRGPSAVAPVRSIHHRTGAAPGVRRRDRVFTRLPPLERAVAAGVAAAARPRGLVTVDGGRPGARGHALLRHDHHFAALLDRPAGQFFQQVQAVALFGVHLQRLAGALIGVAGDAAV